MFIMRRAGDLSIAAQNYLNGGIWELVGEFTEVQSGRKSERPELAKALDYDDEGLPRPSPKGRLRGERRGSRHRVSSDRVSRGRYALSESSNWRLSKSRWILPDGVLGKVST